MCWGGVVEGWKGDTPHGYNLVMYSKHYLFCPGVLQGPQTPSQECRFYKISQARGFIFEPGDTKIQTELRLTRANFGGGQSFTYTRQTNLWTWKIKYMQKIFFQKFSMLPILAHQKDKQFN